MMNRLIAAAMLLVWWTTSPAAGTLAEVVEQALRRHPEAGLAQAREHLAAGYRRQADSFLGGDPEINLGVTGDKPGSDFGYEEYVAGISVPLQLPSHRRAKAALADHLGRLAARERLRLRWEVVGEVLERAWRLRIAIADRKEAMKQWAAYRALVRDMTHRHQVGELSRNDLLLAQQEQVDAESAYLTAVNQETQARLAWRTYTGSEAVPDDLDAYSEIPTATVSLEDHPRLAALSSRLEAAKARVQAARAERRAPPVVSLFAKRDRGTRADDYTDSLGLEVSLPLGTRTPAVTAIAEAETERAQVEAELALARRELELQITQAEQALATAETQLQLAQRKYEYARGRMKLAKRAFELGEMDLYQLLLARREFNQASRDLKLRELEKRHAAARKNHLTGVMPR